VRLSRLDLRRNGNWEDPVRNRWLTRLGSQNAAGDRNRLASYLPDAASRFTNVPKPPGLIAVASIEHAVCVAWRLPARPVRLHNRVTAIGIPERLHDRVTATGIPERLVALLDRRIGRHGGRSRRVIATSQVLQGLKRARSTL
jgi:hypothetical protein